MTNNIIKFKQEPPSTHHTGPPVLFLQPCTKHRPKYGHFAKVGLDGSAHETFHQSFGCGFKVARVCLVLQSAPLGQRLQVHDVLSSPALFRYSGVPVLNPLQSAIVVYGGFSHAVLLLLGTSPVLSVSQDLQSTCFDSSANMCVVAQDTHV
jgi:hypothetical protein